MPTLTVSVDVTENEANVLHVSGRYLSPTDLNLEAYRVHNGQRVTESTVNIDLENGHLRKSKIYWRPSIVADIKVCYDSIKRIVIIIYGSTTCLFK
jgi:hypothetical protein